MINIAEAQAKDGGWYQCTAYNPVGSTATRARLQVDAPREPPKPPGMMLPPVKIHIPYPTRVIEAEYESNKRQ